ncbi:hypothetical protein NL676_007694 [Syzygium grande]|nr:hypothetical protein NL676_007694 [Syzygium grande]
MKIFLLTIHAFSTRRSTRSSPPPPPPALLRNRKGQTGEPGSSRGGDAPIRKRRTWEWRRPRSGAARRGGAPRRRP